MKLISTVLLLIAFITVNAQQLVKLTGNPQVLTVSNLVANADGSISYTFEGKRWTAPEYSYDYARVPKPRAIEAADKALKSGNFVKAEKLYQIEYEKYRKLGWSVYCITGRAKALEGLGKFEEALELLQFMKYNLEIDPVVKQDRIDAALVYLDLLIKAKKYEQALIFAEGLIGSKDANIVFFAFERKGDVALLMKDRKKAVREYLQACYLILDHPRREAILYKAIMLLKEMKDKRWVQLASAFKKRYPNSEYAKKL